MRNQSTYSEIFDLTIRELSAQKDLKAHIPKSDDLERAVKESLEFAIKEWNLGQQKKEKKDIEVYLLGGKRFPDIILLNKSDSEKIGIEVKLHTRGKSWTTTGNSAIASTQEPNLEAIYLLFGHFALADPEFKIRPIDECICRLDVTHKPRYQINMNYAGGDFCENEIGISYNQLRNLAKEDREVLVFSCVAKEKYTEIYHKNKKELNKLIAKSFLLFPELFSYNPRIRYKRMTEWFFAQNILAPNVRDFFSSAGKVSIQKIGPSPLPRVYTTLNQCRRQFHSAIKKTPKVILRHYWGVDCATSIPEDHKGRINLWLNLVTSHRKGAQEQIDGTEYNFRETIEKILDI